MRAESAAILHVFSQALDTMATIKNIARLAGVSPTTVSNVLHGKVDKVSPAVRDRVRAIIDEENYTPNQGAVMLVRSRSRIVGVILFMEPRSGSTAIEDPFVATIIGTLESEIRRAGFFMMLRATSDKDEVLRLAATWKLAGLVMLCVPSEVSSAIVRRIASPIVFVDCYFPDDGQAYHSIRLDDIGGGFEMTRYILSLGHSRVAFMANAADFPSVDSARYEGYRQAFTEAGLEEPAGGLVVVPKDQGERLALYHRLGTEPFAFSALFFSADYYAVEAIDYLSGLGVDIPGRLSVAGFDDNWFSRLSRPRLTTVHQDVVDKGKAAAEMLMRLIHKEPVPSSEVRLPVRLEIRDSVRRAQLAEMQIDGDHHIPQAY